MNDLLSLFDEIETKPVNLISETDRVIVENYWNLFMEKFNGLRAMWAEFVERDKSNTNDKFKINSLSCYVSSPFYSHVWEENLERFNYTFKYDIVNCEKLIQKLLRTIESKVCDYFSKTYGCNIESDHCLSGSLFKEERYNGEMPSLDLILEHIISQNDGMSFEDKGDHDTKLNIGNHLKHKNIKLTSKTVTIEYAFHTRYYSFEPHWEDVEKILDAVVYCFFQSHGLFHILSNADESLLRRMEAGSALSISSEASKMEQIKLFKNQNMSIKFRKAEEAQLFYNFATEIKEMANKKYQR